MPRSAYRTNGSSGSVEVIDDLDLEEENDGMLTQLELDEVYDCMQEKCVPRVMGDMEGLIRWGSDKIRGIATGIKTADVQKAGNIPPLHDDFLWIGLVQKQTNVIRCMAQIGLTKELSVQAIEAREKYTTMKPKEIRRYAGTRRELIFFHVGKFVVLDEGVNIDNPNRSIWTRLDTPDAFEERVQRGMEESVTFRKYVLRASW